ncbi:MAG TPA: hypothetical protein VGP09_07170, partial [Caballeronia sp.]|nr:hypothetical protein [Caballeronia sp.]
MLDIENTLAGSPLLLGDGFVSVETAAREIGLPTNDLLTELDARTNHLIMIAGGCPCSRCRQTTSNSMPT